jgi:methyl-accepting chemotaxis protein
MASTTRLNAAIATRADAIARQTAELTETGIASMRCMTGVIDEIRASTAGTARVLKTIDEIAFQANLLALNAAVQAAHAGQAGQGFAAIAGELRNLAQRSAEVAGIAASLIESAQRNAATGVGATTEASRNLGDIRQNVATMATLFAEIAAASREQNQVIAQVNVTVSELDRVVQQNVASAEESASASEEMSSMAAEMMGILGAPGHQDQDNSRQRDLLLNALHREVSRPRQSRNMPAQAATPAGMAPAETIATDDGKAMDAPHGNPLRTAVPVRPEAVIPLDSGELPTL